MIKARIHAISAAADINILAQEQVIQVVAEILAVENIRHVFVLVVIFGPVSLVRKKILA